MSARIAPLAILAVGLAALVPVVDAGAAQAPIDLGTASSFAVLAGSGITNTGPTTITGDVGTFPNPAETGFGSVTLTGTDHAGDAVTQSAKNALTTAYGVASGSGPAADVGVELGGQTLTPGVYNGPTLQITGTLTLDTLGDPAAVFVFQTPSTLITASNSAVVVLNGGVACNVFWQVGSSATLGTGSRLIGSVLASASISATTGATVQGRLLAQTGAVTLDTNTITNQGCAAGPTTTTTTTTTTADSADGSATTDTAGSPVITPEGSTSATPGGSTTATTVRGSTPATSAGPTPTTVPTPGLAVTGSSPGLPLLGGLTVALGLLLLALSKKRHAIASGH